MKLFLVFLMFFSFEVAFAGTGKFSFVKGKVFFTKKDASEKRARRGLSIGPGDRIRTEGRSYAKVTMSDKNIIHVGPSSEMVLAKYVTRDEGTPDSELNVLYGKVRTALEEKYDGKENRFRVTTEAAVMGVRGTDFLTEHAKAAKQTRATAFEGIVAVAGRDAKGNSIGGQTLTAGQMTVITAGATPLTPLNLPDAIRNSIDKGSKEAKGKKSFESEAKESLNSNLEKEFLGTAIPEVVANPAQPLENNKLIERNIVNSAAGGNANVNVTVEDSGT